VPTPTAITLAWLVAGVLTLAGALVCAELASAFPTKEKPAPPRADAAIYT